jgi:hypothetical protein
MTQKVQGEAATPQDLGGIAKLKKWRKFFADLNPLHYWMVALKQPEFTTLLLHCSENP